MRPRSKLALYIVLALVGLSLQVLAQVCPNRHDTKLNLTRSDLICVGHLNSSLLFITTDPFVYELPESALDPDTTRLDTSKAKCSPLQEKWPNLYNRWYNDTISNSITVQDLSNRSFLFMMLYPPPYDVHIFAFFGLNDRLTSFQQFDYFIDFNKIWISSVEPGKLYMLRTEPTYGLAKYNFNNQIVNASTCFQPQVYLTLCVNDTQIYFPNSNNCSKSYQPIGPRPYSDWQITRGFATKDRFYLFGKENVYSFFLGAYEQHDEGHFSLTKVPKELFTWEEKPPIEPTSTEQSTIDEYVYLTGKPKYECNKTVFEKYRVWWILCLIFLADFIIMSLWYCWLYRSWHYSCFLAWLNIKERNYTDSSLYGEEPQNQMAQSSSPALPVLPASKDVTKANQHVTTNKANDSPGMSKQIPLQAKNNLATASKGKGTLALGSKGKATNASGSKGKTVVSVAKCKTSSTTKENAPAKRKKVRTAKACESKDQTSPAVTAKGKTRSKPSSKRDSRLKRSR